MSTRSQETLSKVRKHLECFTLSEEKLKNISARLEQEFIEGLGKDTHNEASVKMLPTFVMDTPDGTEKGDFLALDVGGTNLRVHHVHVDQKLETKSETWSISKELMEGTGEELFDNFAMHLGEFLDSRDLKGKTLPLGFTFSFPCRQEAIDKSILIHWTKGFSCSGVEGNDVVELLKEAIGRRGDYNIGPVSVVNDTAATMMTCSYENKNCEIGMIIGTGTNACYMEEMKNVERVEGEDGRMCINTEWGGFGDHGSLKDIQTEFDVLVDKTSINPGVHIFEKMISGMYMGEIVRLVLVKLMEDKLLFKGQTSESSLQTPGKFETKFISEIEEQDRGWGNTKQYPTWFGLQWNPIDVKITRLVCEMISTRAAHLCAAAVTTIIKRIHANRSQATTVGVDGTVYKEHPNFKKKLKDMVKTLVPECDITFQVSEDGSGKGAALVAAVVQRLNNKKDEEDKPE